MQACCFVHNHKLNLNIYLSIYRVFFVDGIHPADASQCHSGTNQVFSEGISQMYWFNQYHLNEKSEPNPEANCVCCASITTIAAKP